jgi:hypothetical protein
VQAHSTVTVLRQLRFPRACVHSTDCRSEVGANPTDGLRAKRGLVRPLGRE